MKMNKSVTKLFKDVKLGTQFKNVSSNLTYELRRRTDPVTLEGTLFLYCRTHGQRVEETTKKEWEKL